jgi:hypothetical protein
MLTRFLKGEDFFDRPLITYSSYPMPDEVLPIVPAASYQENNVLDQLKMSVTSGMPHLPAGDLVGAPSFGLFVLVAAVAFVLGIIVARKTMAGETRAVQASTRSSEVRPLTEQENYGSI